MGKLDDKTIVVTGGGRGIGRGIATRLAAEGANVVIADIDAAGAARTAEAIASQTGAKAIGVACDVTERESQRAAIARAVQEFGRLDVMFNNAGVSQTVRFLDTTEEDYDRIMRVNARGVFLGMQEAAEQFKRQGGGGKIVNTASIAGKSGFPLFAAYSASKFAVIGLTQAGARALAEDGITVNAFCPGIIETDMWAYNDQAWGKLLGNYAPGELMKEWVEGIPMKRAGSGEDVAGLVTFLASDDAAYITGQTINVDGGLIMS